MKQHLLIIPFLLFGFQLIAQEQSDSFIKNHWGVRLDLMTGSAYNDLKPMLGATFLTGKHQFYAGIMTNLLDGRGYKPESPLLGSYLSYQFFPFKTRNCFNAYTYFSNNIGRYSYNRNVTFLDPSDYSFINGTLNDQYFVVENTLGVGFETRFKKHIYTHFSVGGSAYYKHYSHESVYTEATDKTAPTPTNSETFKLGIEIKVGVGYRF